MSADDLTHLMDGIPPDTLSKVQAHLKPFQLSWKQLEKVSAQLKEDLVRGLSADNLDGDPVPVKMLPTFIRDTSDGTEKGDFLALDLGGTNLRVLRVRLEEGKEPEEVKKEEFVIPEKKKNGTGEQLFDHIAACLGDFLDSQELKGQTLPLGFTFSFPCKQKGIDKATLIRWTKGFSCLGVEGEDVVKLLKEAINRNKSLSQKAAIGLVVIVNDTVGMMMSCRNKDRSCDIGMVVGTGTNACYMEEMKNVKRVEGEDGRMCINTEWGGFGDDGSLDDILTEFDVKVDQEPDGTDVKKRTQSFEKMIGGKYLGEIVRLVLVKLTEDKLLFQGRTSEALLTRDKFETKFISEIEEPDVGLEKAQKNLSDLGLKLDSDSVDSRVVRLVCATISSRAARLCGVALATLANRIPDNYGPLTVGVDGSVYLKHPNFSKKVKETVRRFAKCYITFTVAKDGSGMGAAMVAAVQQRLALQS